jgi:adenosine deaminase
MFRFFAALPGEKQRELAGAAQLTTLDQFTAYLARGNSGRLPSDVKNLTIALLQTEENLRQAVHALLYEAFADNIVYLELTVCPLSHTRGGLSMEAALNCVLDEIAKFRAAHEIRVAIVINANIEKLGPLDVHRLAQLAVAYQGRGVVGFATTTAEIGVAQMRFFEATFDYLSESFVPVTIFAGETDTESVPCALVRGHARRISGGFKITKSESVLSDVTSHNTAVLISQAPRAQTPLRGWKRSLVRYFTDFGVKLAFCSVHHSFADMTRSQQLFVLGEEAGFDALGVLRLIDRTFAAALMPYKDRCVFAERFWKISREVLTDFGFPHVMNCTYFPELT